MHWYLREVDEEIGIRGVTHYLYRFRKPKFTDAVALNACYSCSVVFEILNHGEGMRRDERTHSSSNQKDQRRPIRDRLQNRQKADS